MALTEQELSGLSIALYNPQLPCGGAESVSREISLSLKRIGVGRVSFVTKRWQSESWQLPHPEMSVTVLPEGKPLEVALSEYAAREAIDILILSDCLPKVAEAVEREAQCRVVCYLHLSPYSGYADYLSRGKLAERRPREWRKLLGHGLHRLEVALGIKAHPRAREERLYRETLEQASALVTLTEGYKRTLGESLGLGKETLGKIFVIPNTTELNPAPRLDKQKEIIYMGRLHASTKRVDRLLAIWARVCHRLPDWRLRLYGTGKDAPYLERLSERLRLPRVEFMGFVPDPQSAYDTASILCLTSEYEGYPMVILEAHNNAVIPIAYGVTAGIRELCGADNAWGVAIPPFDEEAYSEALLALCEDDAYRRRLQTAVLERRHSYAPEPNDQLWLGLINQLYT